MGLRKLKAAMFPKEKGKLSIGRFEVPFRKYGEPGTPWIIAINGAQSTMATWFETVSTFSDYQWVIFDYPGQGGTNIKEGPLDVSWDEQIEILDFIIKRFAPEEKVNLISASWGGAVAMYYAANNSHRLRSLILGSAGFKANDTILNLIEEGREKCQEKFERGEKGAGAQIGNLICDSFGTNVNSMFKNKILKQFEKMEIKDIEIFWAHIQAFKSKKSVDEVVDLTKITCPTLIINGKDDPIIDNKDTEHLTNLIPNSVSALLPNTSHFLHLEDPSINETYYRQFVDAYFGSDDNRPDIKNFKFNV